MNIFLVILQLAFFAALAPLLSGFIAKIKNNIRMRRGQSIFQPYYNLVKLFEKNEVVSEDASWIFRITPFIVISSALTAAVLVPVLTFPSPARQMGDFLALIFILALGRFFLALSALDTGSAFGGMGSSREMFISSLIEPAFCLGVFAVALPFGTTDVSSFGGMHFLPASLLIAGGCFFLITLAEAGRIPVDNQETHLELTMVHEAMVLEYSGRSLAIIEMASYIKQMILFFLIAQVIFPISPLNLTVNPPQIFFWVLWYAARIIIVGLAVALVEVSLAKMRLFRVADFAAFAFILGVMAAICAVLGF